MKVIIFTVKEYTEFGDREVTEKVILTDKDIDILVEAKKLFPETMPVVFYNHGVIKCNKDYTYIDVDIKNVDFLLLNCFTENAL